MFIKIIFFISTLILLTSCKPLDWLGNTFNRSGGGYGNSGTAYPGGVSNGTQISNWLNQNVSAPDTRCSGNIYAANDVQVAPGYYGPWKKKWTEGMIEDLNYSPQSGLLDDGIFSNSTLNKMGCPAFKNMSRDQRKRVVIQFVAELCRMETKFQTDRVYNEGWTNYGLCQQTPSTLRYYGINTTSKELLNNPRVALKSAMIVLNSNLRKNCRGEIPCPKNTVRGKDGIYWGPLRGGARTQTFYQNLRMHINKIHPYCKNENWEGLDQMAYSKVGQQADVPDGECKTVNDLDRNFPAKGSKEGQEIKDSTGEAKQL